MNVKKNKIIFLDIKPSFSDAFRAATELNLDIIYFHTRKNHDLNEIMKYCSTAIGVTKINETELKEIVLSKFKIDEIVGIFTLNDHFLPLITKINNEFFHLPEPIASSKASLIMKNKYLLRNRLDKLSFNPKYSITNSDIFYKNSLDRYPVVIKPLIGHSSLGVEYIDNKDEFSRAVKRTLSVLDKLQYPIKDLYPTSHFNNILIEEALVGDEYSLEVLAYLGKYTCLGICQKSKMDAPFFQEISYQMPASLPMIEQEKLIRAATEILEELNFSNGVAHMEFIMTQNGPKLLDCAPRIGGGGLTHYLVKYSTNFDLFKFQFQLYLQLKINSVSINYFKVTFLYLLQIYKSGIVKKLPDLSKIVHPPILYSYFVKIGELVETYPNYSGLPGFLLFVLDSKYDEIRNIKEQIIKEVQSGFVIGDVD